MLDRRKQPQRTFLIVFTVHAEKRADLNAAVRRLAGLLLIFASDDLMQNVRRFRGRGFDIGQTLAVDQRWALGRFFLVARRTGRRISRMTSFVKLVSASSKFSRVKI